MSDASVKSSALWLGKLLVEEIKCLDAVRSKVEKLQTELNALAAFLTVAVKSRRQDEGVRTALSEARNIAYDCQDAIDTYIHEVVRHGYDEYEGCQLGSVMRWACLIGKAAPVHGIGSNIDELNERISALKDRMKSYGVSDRISHNYEERESGGSSTHRQINELSRRRVYTHEREEYAVVGLEKHLDELVEVVMMNSTLTDHGTMIAICGMGGIGKSTLARELYHHSKLRGGKNSFEAFGWATASRLFQPDRVLRTLMYSLVPENDRERREKIDQDIKADRAHRALYDLMREFKCLVVIDDIWSSSDWASLQAAFPRKNAVGSKILLTTRNRETISGLDPTQVYLHPIQGLDENRSWELFLKTAFPAGAGGAICEDSAKEDLGREMLRHCNGVPLAIVVLGKALGKKERLEDWEQMRKDINKQIQRGTAPNLYKDVYDVLQVSYDELPYYLKHCFLYLANFPEDHEISTAKLYQLWVGEGIVAKENSNESEEANAKRYLNELVSRNMVEVSSWVEGPESEVKTCRLHDLMRDVCIEIANREGFVQLVSFHNPNMLLSNDKHTGRLLMTSVDRDKRLRRIAVYISDHELQHFTTLTSIPVSPSGNVSKAPNLRSLLLFQVNKEEERGVELDCKRLMESISEDYPLLRVFDCENVPITGMLPKKVENMIHLRHLGLANTRVTELPVAIGKLQWLQTLDLRVDAQVFLTIPNVLWKMTRLKHIYLPDDGGIRLAEKENVASSQPRYSMKGGGALRLDGLWNLQTILCIDLDRVDVKGLSKLARLKAIKAACENNIKALHPFLQCSSVKSFELTLHAQIINEEPTILSTCEAMFQLHIHAKPNINFRLSKPLSLDMLPKHLVSLGIWYLQLDYDPLPVLEKLPNLANLRLIMCFGRQMMICSAGGFPQLITLCFYKLPRFCYWEVEEGALCRLKRVLIVDCQLRKIPSALPSSVNVTVHGPGRVSSAH